MSTNLITLIPAPECRSKRDRLWLESADKKCHWCGIETKLVNSNAPDKATRDHVIPRYKGGTDHWANVVLACNLCNNRRAHEDHMRLQDGALLGKYKGQGRSMAKTNRVVLTGDDKKKLFEKMSGPSAPRSLPVEDLLRAQRDQAHKRITDLENELKQWKATGAALGAALEEATKRVSITMMIREKIAGWIFPQPIK